MKTLTRDLVRVAPFDRVITAPVYPSCHIDNAEPFHAIAEDALDISELLVDQYFITLQKLATYQLSEGYPEWMTLDLTLELKRLPSPAKPRIDDWVSCNLPGWHIVEWAMPEPNDEFELMPF